MEQENDVQLIHDTLSGNDTAFSALVEKYQKSVHALIWRKTADYHYAEEITQDTFLQAYQKLYTLQNPYSFAPWLYRIATRQCLKFQRKKRIQTQSLDHIKPKNIEKMTYSQYIADEQAKAANITHRHVVHTLLKRLPKHERTVVTLHYLREMTHQEISQMLGMSIGTVKSRLCRARHRLRKTEPTIWELSYYNVPAKRSSSTTLH